MSTPSPIIVPFMRPFAIAFTRPTFDHAVTLLCGTLLASGRRTVASALRAAGLIDERHFTTYHRVLNRAVWSPLQLSKILLGLMIGAFVATDQPLLIAIDETLERRFGRRVAHKGIYHDAVRSTPGHPATTSGIRWLCCAAIVRLPWNHRAWALPFLTIPAPSAIVSAKLGQVQRTLPERAALLVRLLRRWLPNRAIVVVGDSGFGTVDLALTCRNQRVTWIARMRLTAALYGSVPPQPKGKPGVKPKKGPRRPTPGQILANPATTWDTIEVQSYDGEIKTFDAVSQTALWHRDGFDPVPIRWVLLRDPEGKLKPMVVGCTDEAMSAEEILLHYLQRWNIEVTFQEARRHLGVETQRQWTRQAIERATPCLFGLFSLVVLLAHQLYGDTMSTRQSAWYAKEEATFIDLLAAVRRVLWRTQLLNWPTPFDAPALANSLAHDAPPLAALLEAACYAA